MSRFTRTKSDTVPAVKANTKAENPRAVIGNNAPKVSVPDDDEAEPKVLNDLSQSAGIENATAAAFGQHMDESELLREKFHEAGEAPTKVKRAKLEILLGLLDQNGYVISNKGFLSEVTGPLDVLPHPDSYPENADGEMNKDWRPRTEADKALYGQYYVNEGTNKVLFDYYAKAVSELAEGKAIQKDLADLKNARRTKNGPDPSGPYKGQTNTWLAGKIALRTTHFNGMVSALKGAMACLFMWQKIAETFDDVMVHFQMEHPGKDGTPVSDGVSPMIVGDKDTGERKEYSVSGFNNINIERALALKAEGNGSFNAIVDSTGRGANETGTDTVWELTPERFADNASFLAQYLLQTANTAKILQACFERTKGGGFTENADIMCEAVYNIVESLTGGVYNKIAGKHREGVIARQNKRAEEITKMVNGETKAA